MIINSITEINKQRSRISLETEESFVLYKGEIRELKLKEGEELSDEKYQRIVFEILPKRCKMRALNLLKERNYTSYGLKKKLLEGGYPEKICEDTLEYVSSYGYVNDTEYAMSFIRDHEGCHSGKEIRQKLQMKGVGDETIKTAFAILSEERENYEEESHEDLELELIKKTLRKKNYSANTEYEDRQKLLAYFFRRGFALDLVKKAMHEVESY